MNDSRDMALEVERTPGFEDRAGAGPEAAQIFHEALASLDQAGVRYCLLRDRLEDLSRLKDLDLLVDSAARKDVFAALGRAGFTPRHDRRLRGKWVFLRFDSGRFLVLDVHTGFVQNGLEYMRAFVALSRVDRSGPVSRLCPEDEFLHLLLHNLLGKQALQDKHLARLLELHAAGLDLERVDDHARAFGLRSVARVAMSSLESLAADPVAWRRLRRRARCALLLSPANLVGALRYACADRLRLRRRPVLLALLGPDGAGKTSFADALEALLRGGPLRAGRVYMGCWGHDVLPMRFARRLVPPQESPVPLFLTRCRVPVALTPEEKRVAAAPGPSFLRLGLAAARYAAKFAIFHLALGLEMTCRYVRHIALSRRPIVISDRYVYDLEFRQGRVPFVHGAWLRRLVYRFFPAPDGVLYLTTPYELVERRKPQLDRQQFEGMDRVYRRLLAPCQPLLLESDAPPEAMARDFLTRHWETILERCNLRA